MEAELPLKESHCQHVKQLERKGVGRWILLCVDAHAAMLILRACSGKWCRAKGYAICSRNLLDRWRLLRTHARRSLSTLIDRQLPIPASSTYGPMCDNAQHLVEVVAFYKLL